MEKSYSILILPRRGTRIRRWVLSRWSIRCLLFAGITLVGVSGWVLDDYHWLKVQIEREGRLRVEANDEVGALRDQLSVQRERLFTLHERTNISQKLLASWKGLRKKIRASLPRKRRPSFNSQQVVEELETSLTSLEGELQGLIASIPSKWPTKGWVSSGFGRRRSPFTGKTEFHTGIDIANRKGTPVYAPGDGVVDFVGQSNSNGRSIVLGHGQGIVTQYGHLSKYYVKKGDRVRKGQKIADMGNTGKSTSSHLHYEVRVNGTPIDPRRRLLKRNPSSS